MPQPVLFAPDPVHGEMPQPVLEQPAFVAPDPVHGEMPQPVLFVPVLDDVGRSVSSSIRKLVDLGWASTGLDVFAHSEPGERQVTPEMIRRCCPTDDEIVEAVRRFGAEVSEVFFCAMCGVAAYGAPVSKSLGDAAVAGRLLCHTPHESSTVAHFQGNLFYLHQESRWRFRGMLVL